MNAHQRVLLDMLKEIDQICSRNNISYMLFAGTALGAVRHQGFIPWDDDLDVLMQRKDYEKFLEVAPLELNANTYFLQKEFSEHWPMFFSKLRKKNTTCIEKYHPKDIQTHQGVYVDVFPCDNLSGNRLMARVQFVASKIVIAKCLQRRGYSTNNILKKALMCMCRCVPLKPMLRLCIADSQENTCCVHSFLGASSRFKKSVYPRTCMDTVRMQFEDGEFPVSAHAEEMLKIQYNDYLKIPSESERKCKKHAILLDLEKDYTQYLAFQKDYKITDYQRSIR